MTHKHILIIALRIGAIILGLGVLESFPQQFFDYIAINDELLNSTFWLSVALPNLIKVLMVILLWVFPGAIITSIVPDEAVSNEDPQYFSNLNSALISVAGLYLFILSVADSVYFFTLKKLMAEQFGPSAQLQPVDEAAFIATLALP